MKNWSHYVDNEPLILQYHLSSIFKYYFRLHRVSHIMKRGAEIGAEIALKTKFIQRSPRDLLSSAHCIFAVVPSQQRTLTKGGCSPFKVFLLS